MHVLIREGSAARNLEAIVTGIVKNKMNGEGFCFCTDDKHIEDIEREGHIDHNVRKSILLGMDPVEAIQMATIRPAMCYGLQHLGAIAPGRQADMIVLDDLEKVSVQEVYYQGKIIKKTEQVQIKKCSKELKNTVHVGEFSAKKLELSSEDGMYHVIQMEEGQITTRKQILKLTGPGELFVPDKVYSKIAVVERHKLQGKEEKLL